MEESGINPHSRGHSLPSFTIRFQTQTLISLSLFLAQSSRIQRLKDDSGASRPPSGAPPFATTAAGGKKLTPAALFSSVSEFPTTILLFRRVPFFLAFSVQRPPLPLAGEQAATPHEAAAGFLNTSDHRKTSPSTILLIFPVSAPCPDLLLDP